MNSTPSITVSGRAPCMNCGTTATPLWRRDTDGNPVCNACGETFRPTSPGFMVFRHQSKRPRQPHPCDPRGRCVRIPRVTFWVASPFLSSQKFIPSKCFVCDTQSCLIFTSCSPCPEHVSRGWCIFVLFLPHQCCIRLISTHNHCRFYLRDFSIVNSPGACLGLVMCCISIISPHTKPRLIYAWNYAPEFGQERLLA